MTTNKAAELSAEEIDFNGLRQLMQQVTKDADVCDSDLRGNPITNYDVLLMGAYQDCLLRLVNAAVSNAMAKRAVPAGVAVAVREDWLVQYQIFLADYSRYADGDAKMPFSTLRESLALFLEQCDLLRASPIGAGERETIERVAEAIHYPDCWCTTAYPTLADALVEVYNHFKCSTEPCNVAATGGDGG